MGREAEGAHANNLISVQTHICHLENNDNKAVSFFFYHLWSAPRLSVDLTATPKKTKSKGMTEQRIREEKSADWQSGLNGASIDHALRKEKR